jgi:hypothetical protein
VGILNVLWAGWQLYVRLFARSVTLAAVVFAVLYLPPLFALTGGGSEVAGLVGAGAFSGLLYLVGELLLQGALTEAVREVHEQREVSSIGQLLRTALNRFGGLVGATILVTLLAVGAVIAGIIVIGVVAQVIGPLAFLLVLVGVCLFVVLLTRWALVVPVVVLENAAPRLALGRSKELVRGSGWKVFWALFFAVIVTAVGAMSVQLVLAMLVGPWLAEFAASVLTAPYFSYVVAAMYFALAEPNAPIVPDEDAATWQSVWVDKTL